MDSERYDEMSKQAAYQIKMALDIFKDEPPEIRQQSHNIIMERVRRFYAGEGVVIESPDLVREVPDPEPEINTAGTTEEGNEAV